MTDPADFLRARYAERRALAEAAAEPESWVELNRNPRPSWHVQHWGDPDRAVVSSDPESSAYPIVATLEGDAEESAEARVQFIAANDPAGILADLDAKLALVDDLLAERHVVCEDPWYTCGLATEERDGGECIHETEQGRCTCGLDARRDRRLRLLAQPFAAHPEYLESWRP